METIGEIPETIKPSYIKAFLVNFISYIIPAVIVLTAIYVAGIFISQESITSITESLGISLNFSELFLWAFIGIIGIVLLASLLNMISPLMSKIDVYKEKLAVKKDMYATEIPFDNVVRINYEKKGMANMMKYGTLFIEASGTEKGVVSFEYIDNVENVAAELQNRISRHHYEKQDKIRVQHIMEGF